MEDYFKIGIITSSHGVRGEMKVYPTTDDARRFKKLKQVFVETKEGFKVFEVESARVSDKVLLKLKGIYTPEEVVKYRQRGIFVDRIGIKVICDDGKELGVLKEVMPTGANDVYVVSMDEGKEVLIPAIKDCILDVDVEEGFMKVHLLDGLLD